MPFILSSKRFAESLPSPVFPRQGAEQVTAKPFPLFELNHVKMSQEARGLIRHGDTMATGGVTWKPADRLLKYNHTSNLTSRSVTVALPPGPFGH